MGFSKGNAIFLLGGHDLEMMTIKKHLEENGVAYIDKGLGWGAKLSDYSPEIEQAEREGKEIYAIELEESDDINLPQRYHRIDHHNDLRINPSSLEQVLALLSVAPTREDMLIAANDKDYIPGMKSLNATDEEIGRIRKADRKAQGVTGEEELQAIEDIKNNKSMQRGITVVKTACKRFSPICDALYPYKTLAIYNDSEATIYGENVDTIRTYLSELIGDDKIYFGSGFVGIKKETVNKECIENIISNL